MASSEQKPSPKKGQAAKEQKPSPKKGKSPKIKKAEAKCSSKAGSHASTEKVEPRGNGKPAADPSPKKGKKAVEKPPLEPPKESEEPARKRSTMEKGTVERSSCPWPEWATCKASHKGLFPEDTLKKFASRCYHGVRLFETKQGVERDVWIQKARLRHGDAAEKWDALQER